MSHTPAPSRLSPPTDDPVAITGVGLVTSLGRDRESTWAALCRGECRMHFLHGMPELPDGRVVVATVDVPLDYPGQLKPIMLARMAAEEAIRDAELDLECLNRWEVGCCISGHMGDASHVALRLGRRDLVPGEDFPWWRQWFPSSACEEVKRRWDLRGPSLCHQAACASGLVDFYSAVRLLRSGTCQVVIAGAADALHPLFLAGFLRLGVLGYHEEPRLACRPFDAQRNGFVMGEGGAVFVLERLSHALARGAKVYALVRGGAMMAQAHHVTSMDMGSESLARAIAATLAQAQLEPDQLEYINAHGTGTQQNDVAEIQGVRKALGQASRDVCLSSAKAQLGHLINAAGCVELALTVLALRDGFLPPTANLVTPDPECDLDCLPGRGRRRRVQRALKVSIGFGGHVVAVLLERWNDPATGRAYPPREFPQAA